MSNSARKIAEHTQSTPDARTEQTLALMQTLFRSLPRAEQERFQLEIAKKVRPPTAPRAGDFLRTVLKVLPSRETWSVADLRQEVRQRGIEAQDKQIYNAMGYLTRRGQVRRIGYGQYLVDGVILQTADEFGGENFRHEDAYRVDRSTE